jgi:hypothetical protein
MAKFHVTLTHRVQTSLTYDVIATSADAAKEKAQEFMLDWSYDPESIATQTKHEWEVFDDSMDVERVDHVEPPQSH